MKDDPYRIAAWLVQEYGLERARDEALSGLLKAQEEHDNYALSVWREVRMVLARQAEGGNQSAA